MGDDQATVLLVDDDHDALQLLMMVLERRGFGIVTASNGEDALRQVEQHPEVEAVVLDLMMPGGMDGWDVCDRLREGSRTSLLPIVVLSARGSVSDQTRSYEAGALHHITKPYDMEHLLAILDSSIHLRRTELRAVDSAERYQAIFDASPIETAILDPELRILEMNDAFRRAHPDASANEKVLDACYDEEPPGASGHPSAEAVRTGETHGTEFQGVRGGRMVSHLVHAAPLRTAGGEIAGVIHMAVDMTRQHELEENLRAQVERHHKALEQQERLSQNLMRVQRQLREKNQELESAKVELERLSITDDLTGLHNRRHFDHAIDAEVRRSRRYGHALSVLMIDIDHFKDVNDTWGHAAGDEVLRNMARVFEENLRETDTIARYGGEEFIALLPETNAELARQIADRLREEVAGLETPGPEETLRVTVSVGVTTAQGPDFTAADLIDTADGALYKAKHAGRNRIIFVELAPES